MGPPASKILIIESQLIIAADISLQLLKLGYDVVGIDTPNCDTMKAIRSSQPDLVLMNIKMYGDDHKLDMARAIMEDLGIPVIFVSAHTNHEILKHVFNAQPYAFIPKPFDAIHLERGVESAVDRLKSKRLWISMRQMDHKAHKLNTHLLVHDRLEGIEGHSDKMCCLSDKSA